MSSFAELPLRPSSRAALAAMGIATPTPIQAGALPLLLAGKDVLGQARTGSGKTLAFALPMIERIDERERAVQALVLVPTRELAAQVASVVRTVTGGSRVRTLLLVGGLSLGPQKAALTEGVQVVVGTPGRVLDHIRQGNLKLNRLRVLVLDEADEMLDRGFGPDVERIIATTPRERQTALFSATIPSWVDAVAGKHMRSPETVRIDPGSQPVEHVDHAVYDVPEGGKLTALRALLDARPPGVTLVFGRTKHGVKKLAKQLEALGYPVAALQGNMSQNARDRVMADFRAGTTPILLATNVAARGLDVDQIAQVINYELPETAGLLTHRVGRTGRMGRHGEAITLLSPADEEAWRKLLRDLKRHPTRRPWRGRHEPSQPHNTAPVSMTRPVPTERAVEPARPLVTPSRPVQVVPASAHPAPAVRRMPAPIPSNPAAPVARPPASMHASRLSSDVRPPADPTARTRRRRRRGRGIGTAIPAERLA